MSNSSEIKNKSLPEVSEIPVKKHGLWYCSVDICDFHAHSKEAVEEHVKQKHHYCKLCVNFDPKRLMEIGEPCTKRKRVCYPGGYCMKFFDGHKRHGIEQEEKKTLYVCAKCLSPGDVIKSHTILSRGACDRCHKTRSCYTIQ